MKSRVGWSLLVGLLAVVVVAVGLWQWRRAAQRATLDRALTVATRAADEARWVEARAVLEDHARRRGRPEASAPAARWRRLEFRVAAGLRDFAALEALAAAQPELAATDEDAALWLLRLRLAGRDEAGAEAMRAAWRGRTARPGAWACVDADALLLSGRREEARALLAAAPTTGRDGAAVLLRRALTATRGAEVARALDEAYRLDPTNPDLRALRAAALESAGQPGFARVDYVAALVADPRNPLRRDDLASFYLRQGEGGLAVQTWSEGLGPQSPDFLWERSVFWRRVFGAPRPDAAQAGPARARRFAGWLAALPDAAYWDEAGYRALALPEAHARGTPAVLWLRVLEHLRQGREAEAAEELAGAPAVAVAASPSLHTALRATLAVRAGAKPSATGLSWAVPPGSGHRWWDVVGGALRGDARAAEEFTAVARGPHGLVAAFVAAGWTGPAHRLTDWAAAGRVDSPGWLRYGLVQVKRGADGAAAALAWAEGLPATPETDYLRAELVLALGRGAEAEGILGPLARRGDDTGYAAGWLLATWLLEQGRGADAVRVVGLCPPLAAAPAGTGLRARAAVLAGEPDAAEKLLAPLQEQTLEAGAFVARRAFSRGDLATARRLTELWLARLPDNLTLRANLEEIAAAEGRTPAR